MQATRVLLCLILVWAFSFNTSAQLPRRPWFGARIENTESTTQPGCKVLEVVGGTSEQSGVQPDDILTEINGRPILNTTEFITAFSALRVGDQCQLKAFRKGKKRTLTASVIGRPQETDDNAEVIYSSVPFRNGSLRSIINKPHKEGKLPAMLFIPGYTCSSIDGLPDDHPYKRIIDIFVDHGFVTYRVEKSGLGDSQNTPSCESCDLQDEIENFTVGLKALKSLPYVDTNQIIIFGHSMGGIIAPAISSVHPVAGVIVYGTTAKSWFEYTIELNRIQSQLAGMNPLEVERSVRKQYEPSYRFYVLSEDLESIASTPATDSLLRSDWQYDGNGKIYGRNANYWRQIQGVSHLDNWKNTKARVLVMFGESDFQAFSKADHEQIVSAVNHFRPGTATLATFPLTDHYFAKSGTMQQAFDVFSSGNYASLFQSYNPAVGMEAATWSKSVIERIKPSATQEGWVKMNTDKYAGKQDDIYFVDDQKGWYINGYGRIYHTNDGGNTWTKQLEQKGTFFRCIAFIDSLRGFVGTVGTDYFPNVTDTIPLYQTQDGGTTWTPVAYKGPYVKGLCAIDIVKESFINHGQLDVRYHIYAVGRVGSPANALVSHDSGQTWESWPVNEGQMLFDIKMFDTKTGIACSASSADIATSNALILRTEDGGHTWRKVYQSNRPYETTWKVSFPSPLIGYATIQSYNLDPQASQQRIAKTTDGGITWSEINLVTDASARQFGVGFINDMHGFVGTYKGGFETLDGGLSWQKVDLGVACNKIRLHKNPDGSYGGFAIGVDVLKGYWRK